MKTIRTKLKSIISPNQRIAEIEQSILAMLKDSIQPYQLQHLKPLWYKERIHKALQGKYETVSPVNLEFVPSLDCNLRCPPCTYSQWKSETAIEQGKRKMSYENMETLLDKIESVGVKGVTVTGGGEPFANPYTIKGLEYAETKQFETGVFTNGTLLNPTIIERIAQLKLSFIRISINSGESRNYLAFHGITNPSIFNVLKKNIALLGKSLYNSKTTYGLAVVVNEVNVDYITSVAELVRELFDSQQNFKIDYITYRPVINYGQINPNLNMQIRQNVAQKALENFKKVENILNGLPVSIKFASDYFLYAAEATNKLNRGYDSCIGHSWCGSVAYDGGVYLCSERNGNPKYLMGNLLTSSLEEIWESEQRAKVLKNIAGCPPACKVHRINLLLHSLTKNGILNDTEVEELQNFLDIIRQTGEPEKLSFLSW